jgi:phage anti-repressor protein
LTTAFRDAVFGFDNDRFAAGERVPIAWQEQFATNGHVLVAGKSGTGKTFTLRRIITQLARPLPGREPIRVFNFDVHSDMQFQGESRVLFSESTAYGINPLRLSADPHFGGVRKCVQGFIDMLNDSAPRSPLGHRQVSALRNILYDLYESRGFRLNDPDTWAVDDEGDAPAVSDGGRIYLDVPFDERDDAKAAAKAENVVLAFDGGQRSWWCSAYLGRLERWPTKTTGRRPPTVPDAARFIAQRLRSMYVGGGTKAVRMLEDHNKRVQTWTKLLVKLNQGLVAAADVEALKEEVQASAGALVESFTDYVMNIESGRELDMLTRYESAETLRGLADRLDTLISTGIFRARRPPFDPECPIWSYDIAPLRDAEQRFFVWTCLQQIFDRAKERGPVAGASEVREVVVLDEAHKFFAEKDTNVLDILARESRKFGIALICASQAPSHFSEDFLGNVGTKILLGLDSQYHDSTVRKMRVDSKVLEYVVAGKIAAVQVSDKRDMSHRFYKTRVGN